MACENTLASIWPDDLTFYVQASGGYINPGGQVFTLPEEFANWKLRILRGNIPLDYGNQGEGDPYFTIDFDSLVVTLSADVELKEKFVVQAYKPVT